MTEAAVRHILAQGEGLRVEFKEARMALPHNLFDTVCAMLNQKGGDILMGIRDDGAILGIDRHKADAMRREILALSCDASVLYPPFPLEPNSIEIHGHLLLHIRVPVSSQIHEHAGNVFNRSGESDLHVHDFHAIAALEVQKQARFSESRLISHLRFEDFEPRLFQKARNLIRSHRPDHPWLALDDQQLLRSAGLWRRDFASGKEGYTLAAALMFAPEDVIHSILPHYKTDAIVRIQDRNRYDDREIVTVNLIEAYEQLMAFIAKHLPDRFYLEGTTRRSLRELIFREVVANLLIHREYTNAAPSQILLYADHLETSNPTIPHQLGPLNPATFTSYPKNPTLMAFFRALGRAEELGSGLRNVADFLQQYTGSPVTPIFQDGYLFQVNIPLPGVIQETASLTNRQIILTVVQQFIRSQEINPEINSRMVDVIELLLLEENQKRRKMSEALGITELTLDDYLRELRRLGIVEYRGARKNGGYYLSPRFRSLLPGN